MSAAAVAGLLALGWLMGSVAAATSAMRAGTHLGDTSCKAPTWWASFSHYALLGALAMAAVAVAPVVWPLSVLYLLGAVLVHVRRPGSER